MVYTLRDDVLLSFSVFHAVTVQATGGKGSGRWGADLPISLTALPPGCHEAAVRAGTARDEEGGGGIGFLNDLRLVRGKVASRKELSQQP